MRNYFKILLAIVSVLSVCTGLVSAEVLPSEPELTRFKKKDYSKVKVGSLSIRHKDTLSGLNAGAAGDNVSHPGIFGSKNHYIMLGRRSQGFGGSAGNLELIIPSDNYLVMLGTKKGGFRLIDSLYCDPNTRPPSPPDAGAFLDIDYSRTTKKFRTTAFLKRDPESNCRFVSGQVTYKQVVRKNIEFLDRVQGFPIRKYRTEYRYLFKFRGRVKNLVINRTNLKTGDVKTKTKKGAKITGKFLVTIIRYQSVFG